MTVFIMHQKRQVALAPRGPSRRITDWL